MAELATNPGEKASRQMIVSTEIRDCLYLNWALPARALPPAPESLRYDVQPWREESVVFSSALLFRQEGPRMSSVPMPRMDAPQFQLHLCTSDENGVPSVLIRTVLTPGWYAPGARLITRQPARSARLVYPASVAEAAEWRWEVRRGERLIVEGSAGPPPRGFGPDFGTWEETVAYFRRRSLGFTESLRGLRRVEIRRSRTAVTPVRVAVQEDALLLKCLADLEIDELPSLHSAWLSAPMTISYELSSAERSRVGSQLPAPG